ncbi:MAG: prephenate dehydrogenase [Pyrinomonadaceae bacterium]
MIFERITVVGCGLIGASFALALRECEGCGRVAGWDQSDAVLREALRRGVIDEVDQALGEGRESASDLVYLAMPVGEIVKFLRGRGESIRPGALVTDAGSTKAEICRAAAEALPPGRRFVGGHPVAGSQHAGLEYASASLFADAPYALVTDAADEGALAETQALVEVLGARVVLTSAAAHDRVLAYVSHLPQLLSGALNAAVRDQTDAGELLQLAGPGYRDMTRLAASPWSVWRDIVGTNAGNLAGALDGLMEKLDALREELRQASAGEELHVTRELFGRRE